MERKTTQYFQSMRQRKDRGDIEMDWIERVIFNPERTMTQTDGRIKKWGNIPAMEDRYHRVILLEDGETLHNAFFDRGFTP